jgi:altronate hydrolase
MSMKSGPPRVLRVHDNDDVAVTLEAIGSGATLALDSEPLIVTSDIPKGHKIALRNFAAGDAVRKYGHIIGRTNCMVSRGEWLHEHNIESMLTGFVTENVLLPQPPPAAINRFATGPATGFMGYRRADGRIGTRNEIWILAIVGCVAKTVERIARDHDAASTAHELLELVLATASGRPARNELNDERSIAIWKRGVTL